MVQQELNDESEIAFGKYKGTKLGKLSSGYLFSLYDHNIAKGNLRTYIIKNVPMARIQEEINLKKNAASKEL